MTVPCWMDAIRVLDLTKLLSDARTRDRAGHRAHASHLAGDFPAQAVILLYRMPSQEAESALFALYGETAPASWYTQRAAASLLALHPPAGFAASLFSNTTVTSHVFVSLPEVRAWEWERAAGTVEVMDNRPSKRTGLRPGNTFCGKAVQDVLRALPDNTRTESH